MATEAMKKRGKASKDKGSRGERLLSAFLNSFGLHLGVHVECKFVERLNVRAAMDQAITEAKKRKDGIPTVFWKVSRKPWLTIMLTEDWVKLYKMARGRSECEGSQDVFTVRD